MQIRNMENNTINQQFTQEIIDKQIIDNNSYYLIKFTTPDYIRSSWETIANQNFVKLIQQYQFNHTNIIQSPQIAAISCDSQNYLKNLNSGPKNCIQQQYVLCQQIESQENKQNSNKEHNPIQVIISDNSYSHYDIPFQIDQPNQFQKPNVNKQNVCQVSQKMQIQDNKMVSYKQIQSQNSFSNFLQFFEECKSNLNSITYFSKISKHLIKPNKLELGKRKAISNQKRYYTKKNDNNIIIIEDEEQQQQFQKKQQAIYSPHPTLHYQKNENSKQYQLCKKFVQNVQQPKQNMVIQTQQKLTNLKEEVQYRKVLQIVNIRVINNECQYLVRWKSKNGKYLDDSYISKKQFDKTELGMIISFFETNSDYLD